MNKQEFKNLTLSEIEVIEKVIEDHNFSWNETALKNVEIAISQEFGYLLNEKEMKEVQKLADLICSKNGI